MLSHFMHLLFPRVCLLCRGNLSKSEQCICFGCLFLLPKSHFLKYPDNPMARNLWGRVNIKMAASLYSFKKGNQVQSVLHLIKYRNQQKLGKVMGINMAIAWKETGLSVPDAVLAVPMHREKQKVRGYNQSDLLASGIASQLNTFHMSENLVRIEAGESQTRKSRYDRWVNVSDKFTVINPDEITGKHLMLVDDVFTTGATMEACIISLNSCKPASISVYTLASTL